MKHSKRVLIVGGGVAGLSAAAHLSATGIPTVLLESRGYLGGRARSFVDDDTGETIDNGQHVLMGCYSSFLGLLDFAGTGARVKRQPALKVAFRDLSGRHDLLSAPFAGSVGVGLAMMMLRELNVRSKLGLIRFALALKRGNLNPGDRTAEQFLRDCGQTDEAIDRLWTPIVLATLNAPIGAVSAEPLVTVMKLAFFGANDASTILIPGAGLSEILAPAAVRLQDSGCRIETSATVDRLVRQADGSFVYPGIDGVFSDVVLAVGPRQAARLASQLGVSEDRLAQWRGMELSPIVSIYLWYDRGFMDTDFVAVLGGSTQWVFNRRVLADASDEQRRRYPGHISLTISAGFEESQTSSEAVVQRCTEEMRSIFPSAKGAHLLASKVIKEKHATVLFSPETQRQRPATGTDIPGLWLAGDWTDTGLPATLEGAARSGRAAAREVARASEGGGS